jgi:hypothetical protein
VPVPGHVVAAGSARPSLGQALPRDPLLQRPAATDGTAVGPPGGLLPRLLDAPTAAHYLGVSERTLRALEAAGTVHRVAIPLPRGGEVRKVLYDRLRLDQAVAGWARP